VGRIEPRVYGTPSRSCQEPLPATLCGQGRHALRSGAELLPDSTPLDCLASGRGASVNVHVLTWLSMITVAALLAQKGGVGKSSLAVALAVANDLGGSQSALVDLDPQGTTSVWGRLRQGAPPEVFSAHPPRLRRVVEDAGNAGATLIVIDTAPRERAGAVAAAEIADMVLIPCRPAAPDLAALPATLEVAEDAGTQAVVVVNQAPARGSWIADARDAVRESGAEVCPVVIGQRVAHAKAFIRGKTAQELEPTSKAAAEVGELYDWIIRRAT